MKRILAISAAALLSGSLLAAPAMAQVSVGAGVSAGGSAGASTDTGSGSAGGSADGSIKLNTQAGNSSAQVDTGTTAAIGGSWDGLMSALSDASVSGSIKSMSSVGSVNVIKISSLDNADMDALAKAKTDNMAAIDDLDAAIEGNAQVKAALDAKGVAASDVVAANIAADGSLTVYVE